jgi:ribosomal protein S18 acetylase RimI-like enzyme
MGRAAAGAHVTAVGRPRAVAFIRDLQDACAQRIVPAPGGHALLDDRHPDLWDANHLRVETREPPDPAALADAAEELLGDLPFRAITALHEPAGAALESQLLQRGYKPFHDLLMLLGDTPPQPDPAIAIAEVPLARVAASRRAAAVELGTGDDEVGRQLASRDTLIAQATEVRCFAVIDADGELVARTQLYRTGTVAQVENVYTLPAHRGRGYAGALVTHAARTAREAGADVVFLVTDSTGRARPLYRRLGFAAAGLLPRWRLSRRT